MRSQQNQIFRFRSRDITLISVYLIVLATIVCAVVADFITLLLSRALIGLCLGLNFSSLGVMAAKLSGSKEILDVIVFVGAIMFSGGGAWCGVLGFFLLDHLGWRGLILLTSLPVFIPAIFMIQCVFTEKNNYESAEIEEFEDRQEVKDDDITSLKFTIRVMKLGLFSAISTFQGWGIILLVPTMIQLLKIKEAGPNHDCHVTVTQGAELLLVALVTSAAIPGRLFVHFTRNKFSFRVVQLCVAVMNVACFTIMLIQDSLAGIAITNLIVKLLYGASAMAARYLVYDKRYFGPSRFALGCGITHSLKLLGGVAGTALVAFFPVSVVLTTCLVLGVVQISIVLTMTEVQQL